MVNIIIFHDCIINGLVSKPHLALRDIHMAITENQYQKYGRLESPICSLFFLPSRCYL
jgi:hypothetical protein